MNKRRLLKLADLLEADAKNKKGIKFNLFVWGEGEGRPGIHCGTMACAMGLAALSGAFRRAGLRTRIVQFGDGAWDMGVKLGGLGGTEAASALFDIDREAADWLFTPTGYQDVPQGASGERLVAKRIRDFVAGKATP